MGFFQSGIVSTYRVVSVISSWPTVLLSGVWNSWANSEPEDVPRSLTHSNGQYNIPKWMACVQGTDYNLREIALKWCNHWFTWLKGESESFVPVMSSTVNASCWVGPNCCCEVWPQTVSESCQTNSIAEMMDNERLQMFREDAEEAAVCLFVQALYCSSLLSGSDQNN